MTPQDVLVFCLLCLVQVARPVVGAGGAAAWSLLSISNSTVFCQQRVYEDAQNDAYNAINKPLTLDSFDNLEQYGDAFSGVSPVVLQPGLVTPQWVDADGKERGQAVLWVPDGVERDSPRLLFVHGGGWTDGSPTTDGYAPFGAQMARSFNMPVLLIDYTLAPGGNFSIILEEVGMSAHFLATHEPLDLLEGKNTTSNSMSEAPPMFISGDSSGGGSALSALVAQASPDGLPMAQGAVFDGGVMYSPWINLESNGPTYYSQLFGNHSDGDVLLGDVNFGFGNPDAVVTGSQDGARQYWNDLKDPVANPFYAPESWLENIVPISLHVGMPELLQSDSTIFGQNAAQAGASWVETHAFDGMWHVFQMYSDGCGSGSPLVLAQSSLNVSKQFYDTVLLQGKNTQSDGIYCAVNHYEYPLGEDSAQGIKCATSSRPSSSSSSLLLNYGSHG
eukprot:jgi/Picre1/35500/NNA_002961.t1